MKTSPKGALVKICGITNVDDARWAASFGVDFIGVNFCKESPRKVSLEKAKEIVQSLPSFVKSVGVVVNAGFDEIAKIVKIAGLNTIQLHGDETPEDALRIQSELKVNVWKAIRVADADSISKAAAYAGKVDAILLDTFKPGEPGGTGETFDWDIATQIKQCGIPIFLAGGLTPENVGDAIARVEPWGVDVASGVEKTGHHRSKDINKVQKFITNAKGQI
jgi:phosphoribosylanthranilate isomerase